MKLKQFYRYVFGFLLSVFVFTGCGSSNSGGEFDGDGNPVGSASSNKIYQKNYTYDSTNRVVKEDLNNGSYIEYTYDDSGNLISQQVVK